VNARAGERVRSAGAIGDGGAAGAGGGDGNGGGGGGGCSRKRWSRREDARGLEKR